MVNIIPTLLLLMSKHYFTKLQCNLIPKQSRFNYNNIRIKHISSIVINNEYIDSINYNSKDNQKDNSKSKDNPIVINNTNIPTDLEIQQLTQFIQNSKYLIAITGAGISTSSGIPDYRGPNGSYMKGHKPMYHQDFMQNENNRKRYWARSMIGWINFNQAKPNAAHISLSKLENSHILKYIITQNVDRLHSKAGSRNVIDIHGRIDQVKCQNRECQNISSRRILQHSLEGLNPLFIQNYHNSIRQQPKVADGIDNARADGDAELGSQNLDEFIIPACMKCGGILKPNVVMFGDNVNSSTVTDIYHKIDEADALLIVGTSLEVYSAYRFVDYAHKRNIPIAIINYGETRAERQKLSSIVYKSEVNCAILLEKVINIILK